MMTLRASYERAISNVDLSTVSHIFSPMIGDNETFGINQSCYLPDELNSTLLKYSLNSIFLSILHINCCSTFDGISALLNSLNFHFSVMGVTETWLTDNSLLCNIQGFSFLHNIRAVRRGGGCWCVHSGKSDS